MNNVSIKKKQDRPFTAMFRFYEELNDFLRLEKQKCSISYAFNGNPSIKDAIEAQGIPHTEVDLIIVNGESVGFDYHLKDGDRVAVYPLFESTDVLPMVKLRDKPLRDPKFILDVHLGKLARLMRLFGFDTLYRNDYHDSEIVNLSVSQKRIVLTHDRALLHARVIIYGYWIRSMNAVEQLSEVIKRFDLKDSIVPFRMCLVCNGLLQFVDKEKVVDKLEPKTKLYYDTFFRCIDCGRIFWKGSHFEKLEAVVKRFKPAYHSC